MPTTSSMRCSPSTGARRRRPSIQCRPIVCAGNTSSASTSCAAATFPRLRAASTCTAARCSGSSPSARRSSFADMYSGSRSARLRAPRLARSDFLRVDSPRHIGTLLIRPQDQLLHPPIEDLGHVELVLGRAGHLVDPPELVELLAGLAEHAEHLAVE